MSANEHTIPASQWIPHPVSDHGDMERPEPTYGEGLTGDAKKEYDAAQKKPKADAKPKSKKRRRGKR